MGAALFGVACDYCRTWSEEQVGDCDLRVSLQEMGHEWRVEAGDSERQKRWHAEVQAEKAGGGLQGVGSPSLAECCAEEWWGGQRGRIRQEREREMGHGGSGMSD